MSSLYISFTPLFAYIIFRKINEIIISKKKGNISKVKAELFFLFITIIVIVLLLIIFFNPQMDFLKN
jgi:hypothetical protein